MVFGGWDSLAGNPDQTGKLRTGKKYPVLVYYYRFFSNHLYDFNRVELSHRPVFFADRIETPLLIMFGDKDDAVP